MSVACCPICQKWFEVEQSPAMPFCSERCRTIDLGRWLDEKNRLPYEPEEKPEEPQSEQ